ncbi:protein DMP5-like [Euphorbia lathyris]|uniref:protein DMP5-like n=1 Tax=Euphorbia lathyris TaxID=212925 RepID=UPI003313A790
MFLNDLKMSTIRARRSTSSKQPPSSILEESSCSLTSNTDHNHEPETPKPPASLSQRAISQTLTSTAQLANLLPTGTVLAFQLLTPIFTNNGVCDSATRPLTFLLLGLLAASCFLASFTDSVRSNDGQVYYGLATFKGMFLFDCPDAKASGLPDLSKYKMKLIDGVRAVLSVLVFMAIGLRDKNVLSCFYPKPKHETQQVLDIVPIGIGLLSSFLFVVFPTKRHGIGFPVTQGK